jgi:hypothetical protein
MFLFQTGFCVHTGTYLFLGKNISQFFSHVFVTDRGKESEIRIGLLFFIKQRLFTCTAYFCFSLWLFISSFLSVILHCSGLLRYW